MKVLINWYYCWYTVQVKSAYGRVGTPQHELFIYSHKRAIAPTREVITTPKAPTAIFEAALVVEAGLAAVVAPVVEGKAEVPVIVLPPDAHWLATPDKEKEREKKKIRLQTFDQNRHAYSL